MVAYMEKQLTQVILRSVNTSGCTVQHMKYGVAAIRGANNGHHSTFILACCASAFAFLQLCAYEKKANDHTDNCLKVLLQVKFPTRGDGQLPLKVAPFCPAFALVALPPSRLWNPANRWWNPVWLCS